MLFDLSSTTVSQHFAKERMTVVSRTWNASSNRASKRVQYNVMGVGKDKDRGKDKRTGIAKTKTELVQHEKKLLALPLVLSQR